jgi:hypothetical protein
MAVCGCCASDDKGEVFKPRNKRWCTDVLCLIFLVIASGAMLAIGYVCVSAHPGLIDGLIYPTDGYGNYCGKPGTKTENMPKVFYPDLDNDIVKHSDKLAKQQYLTFLDSVTRVCAPSCPEGVSLSAPSTYGGGSYPTDKTAAVPTFTYVYRTQEVFSRCFPVTTAWAGASSDLCVTPQCTDSSLDPLKASLSGTLTCAVLEDRPDETTTWETCPDGASAADCALRAAACTYKVKQSSQINYLPEDFKSGNSAATTQLAAKVKMVIGAYDSVLQPVATVAVFGVVVPLVIAIGWCVLLWFFAGFIVYVAIFLVVIFELMLSAYLCYKSGWFDSLDTGIIVEFSSGIADTSDALGAITNSSAAWLGSAAEDESVYYQIAAVISIAFTVLSIILIIMWKTQIVRCIAIVKEVTKVFRSLPVLMIWSLQHLVVQLGLLVMGLMLVMWTLDDEVWAKVKADQAIEVSWQQEAAVTTYCVLVVLWLINWIAAIAWASMSCAVAYWFTYDNAPGAEHKCCKTGTGFTRLASATWTITSKHLGSLAVGAFVIALCQTLRLGMKLLDSMTQQAQDKNFMLKVAMKCMQCCMWCLQKTVEFVSFYGYVYVAIEGCSFCWACKQTFQLVLSNPGQVSVNQIVKLLLSFLMTWSNPVLCATLCFYTLDSNAAYGASGYEPIYPSVFVFLCAYVIASNVSTVYSCSIDTIFLCAFKDIKENGDSPKYLSNDLRRAFGFDKAGAEGRTGGGKGEDEGGKSSKVAPAPKEDLVEDFNE